MFAIANIGTFKPLSPEDGGTHDPGLDFKKTGVYKKSVVRIMQIARRICFRSA